MKSNIQKYLESNNLLSETQYDGHIMTKNRYQTVAKI